MDLVPILTQKFETFLIITMRVGGIFFTSAFFGNRLFPIRAKAALTLFVAILILPIVPLPKEPYSGNLIGILLTCVSEISFGVIIGFSSLLLFIGIQMAGEIIGFQMGFSIVNVIDPMSQSQVSTIAEFKFIIATLIYLAINGHHFLLSGIVQSFQLIPPGEASLPSAMGEAMTRMCVDVFVIAMKISAPAMITLFLTSVALGIIARTVPQMNVFIVGFPLGIGVGFLILATGISYFGNIFAKLLSSTEQNILDLIMLGRH